MESHIQEEKLAYISEKIRLYRCEITLAVFLMQPFINSILFMTFLIALITYTSGNNKGTHTKHIY